MLDFRDVVAESDVIRELLRRRDFELPIDEIELLNSKRLSLIQGAQERRTELKAGSKEIDNLRRQHGTLELPEVYALRDRMTELKQQIGELESELANVEASLDLMMLEIPNTPADNVPVGKDDEDNEVLRFWGERPSFDYQPKAHDEIGAEMGVFDFARASKLSGARFSVLWGAASRLEKALMNFFLDMAILEHGYYPVSVPYMVSRETMTGTGQLPKFEEDLFRTSTGSREYFLVPTAEVPVTNLHSNEIVQEEDLPLTYCSLTPCFRAEAGSSGRDVRGLLRQHQFDKVEMVRFCKPSESWNELEILTSHAEKILQRLELHYRVVALCTGDLGFAAKFTYDLEVWLPGQNAYREVSSCSNYGDYQARRANIKYKRLDNQKNELLHTLNGSGMPIGRTMIAIMEQNQTRDGCVNIPKALQDYTGFEQIRPDGSVR
jgi:seryl-tRNA synthetase